MRAPYVDFWGRADAKINFFFRNRSCKCIASNKPWVVEPGHKILFFRNFKIDTHEDLSGRQVKLKHFVQQNE